VRGLTVCFGPLVALEGVDLEVVEGELVVIAGESGAGKTTLVRCIAGEVGPFTGEVLLFGEPVVPGRRRRLPAGLGMVWQDLALCENLSIAENLALGRERRFLLRSDARMHNSAVKVLAGFGIHAPDATLNVRTLTGAQRQLLAVARAMLDKPRLLILDEPTRALGAQESAEVEALIARLREEGTTILLVSHDLDQIFRLADRIVVLRAGRVVSEVDPRVSHPDDVLNLMSGQPVASSARGQLDRLHGLADRLASADRSSSLALILSTLGAALGIGLLAIHLVENEVLTCVEAHGLPVGLRAAWQRLPLGFSGGPIGMAAETGQLVVEADLAEGSNPGALGPLLAGTGARSFWAVPVSGAGGVLGVVSALRAEPGPPSRDELDLVSLYAGYLASALERDRLFAEARARNRVLETVREVLRILTGPVPLDEGLVGALRALRSGLQASEVALVVEKGEGRLVTRAALGASGPVVPAPASLIAAAQEALVRSQPGQLVRLEDEPSRLAVGLLAPGARAVLVASWIVGGPGPEAAALLVDAASSLRLALEREKAAEVDQEAAALRRSRELQRSFLSRLGHELRTPLTGIRGYATSLLQPDVTWDGESERRFLSRIAVESARLGRLVDDLLEFSVIESGILRLERDWCEVALVLEAAASCIPPERSSTLQVRSEPGLPAIWADHDRLEEVFVNLLDNALRHNPPGTAVEATVRREGDNEVVVDVRDDGPAMPPELAVGLFEPGRRWFAPTAGTGLGLLIAKGIAEAHGGRLELAQDRTSKHFRVVLPIEPPEPTGGSDAGDDVLADPGSLREAAGTAGRLGLP
jgi:signal transduction histidine kinase/ABC-type multidrug transport system ATPase subunit